VPRESVGLLVDARRALARSLDETRLAGALSDLLGERVSVRVSSLSVEAEDVAPAYTSSLMFATSDDEVRVRIDLDRQLGRALVSRVVGRPGGLGDLRAANPPEIDAALLAVISAVARRAHGSGEALHPVGPGSWSRAPGERHLAVRASVMIGGDAYGVNAAVLMRKPYTAAPASAIDRLSSLGELPISFPVVIAVASVKAGDIYGIAPGDVFLPGAGWTARASAGAGTKRLTGQVMLLAPGQGRGIAGTLGESGEIVVVGVKATSEDAEAMMTNSDRGDQTATSEVILDAPLVVRVELGAVTLAAREWAALGSGDVIALAKRVSEPVVLRIGGLEVARGELVDIEGELGVRIRERIPAT
jgi:type III secretion protein Q